MLDLQVIIENDNVSELQTLLSSNNKMLNEVTHLQDSVSLSFVSFTPLEMAVYLSKPNCAAYLIKAGSRVSSLFMVNHYHPRETSDAIKKLLKGVRFQVSTQPPKTVEAYEPGKLTQLLQENFNLIREESLIRNAICDGNAKDLALLIRLGISFPQEDELFLQSIKNNDATEKLTLLAKANVLTPEVSANLMHKALLENFDPSPFLTANIHWFHPILDLTKLNNFIENDAPLRNQLLLDFLLKTNYKLLQKIPLKSFNINTTDADGLSFLHKTVLGHYSKDSSINIEIIRMLMQRGINPLLRTIDGMTAYMIAVNNKQTDLIVELTQYSQIYLKTYPSEKDSLPVQNRELTEHNFKKSIEINLKQMMILVTQCTNRLNNLENKLNDLTEQVKNNAGRITTLESMNHISSIQSESTSNSLDSSSGSINFTFS